MLGDPAENCRCHERAYPEGYEEPTGGYPGRLRIENVTVDTPRATLEVREMGEGRLASFFQPLADALRRVL